MTSPFDHPRVVPSGRVDDFCVEMQTKPEFGIRLKAAPIRRNVLLNRWEPMGPCDRVVMFWIGQYARQLVEQGHVDMHPRRFSGSVIRYAAGIGLIRIVR